VPVDCYWIERSNRVPRCALQTGVELYLVSVSPRRRASLVIAKSVTLNRAVRMTVRTSIPRELSCIGGNGVGGFLVGGLIVNHQPGIGVRNS